MDGRTAQKNRPGQRTRRKMILQKYGKDAKVLQQARARKVARFERFTLCA